MHISCELNVKNIHFVCQIGVFEHLFGLPEQHILIFIPRTVVPQQQLPYPCITGHHSRLSGCGMVVFLGRLDLVLAISTFVIEGVDTFYQLMKRRDIAGVAAIGIASGGVGLPDQATMRDDVAIGGCPAGSVLDVVDLTDWYLIGLQHLWPDVRQEGFLANQVAAGGQSVLQGDGLYCDATILIDHGVKSGVDRMELHLEAQVVSEEVYLTSQDRPKGFRAVDMKGSRPTDQPESGDHADKPKAMVTMQMGYEDMAQFGKTRTTSSQLSLRPFCTVEHQELITYLHQLGRGIMTKCGKRTPAP